LSRDNTKPAVRQHLMQQASEPGKFCEAVGSRS